tara:strand:- start:4838 stop:5989 length:1152 start_codon:yes stop_codon:yes gene_type:complete
MKKINTVLFGATGSIGDSVMSLVKKNSNKINLEGITCNKNINKLIKIANLYKVKKIGFNEVNIKNKKINKLNKFDVYSDLSQFHKIISEKTDIIIFAISGLNGLDLLLRILKSGKKLGIANKECIISLGYRLNSIAKKYSTQIIPLDSEHNSIYHLLKNNYENYKLITITATGGPFLNYNLNNLKDVTPKQAIRHPVWKMGKKISIDSATMMNKALEIIEAQYLFNLKPEKINAIIHPQAVIHALINYENGASAAILSKPDMKIPISSLFFQFNKYEKDMELLDLTKYSNLEFISINEKKFPAMKLVYHVMRTGGLFPHVFNYLNELLVNLFMEKKIVFTDIVRLNDKNLERVFSKNSNILKPNLDDIKNINNWIDNNLFIGN